MASNQVTVNDKGWAKIKRNLKAINEKSVFIGVQGVKAKEMHKDAKATNVDIAIWNHFGTEHIPERPFIQHTIDANRSQIQRRIAASITLLTAGNSTTHKELGKLGLYVTGLTKDEIEAWVSPPNAEKTVKKKGFNNPLIETRQLLNSITHEVR